MDNTVIRAILECLRALGIQMQPGLTESELRSAEDRFGFSFPPDLRSLLAEGLPVAPGFPDWRHGGEAVLRKRLAWPVEGVLFDIQSNLFWLDAWGPRPEDMAQALRVGEQRLRTAPLLVPIYAHRYIPCDPHEEGNPILSVSQTDIIYYGHDLQSYFNREFRVPLTATPPLTPRRIPFWSELADA